MGHVACMGDRRVACRMLVDIPNEKGLLGRPGHWKKENFKIRIQELE